MNGTSDKNGSSEIVSTVEIQPDRRRLTIAERVAALASGRQSHLASLRAEIEAIERKFSALEEEGDSDALLSVFGAALDVTEQALRAILTGGKVPIRVIRRAAVHAVLAHNEDCDAGQRPCRKERWDEFDGPIQLLENPATTLHVARRIAANVRATPERDLLRALLPKGGGQ